MLSVEELRKGFGSGRRRLEVLKGILLGGLNSGVQHSSSSFGGRHARHTSYAVSETFHTNTYTFEFNDTTNCNVFFLHKVSLNSQIATFT